MTEPDLYFETERLIIRRWRQDDLDHLYQLRSNPKVMEHFAATQSLEQVKEILPRLIQKQEQDGFAFAPVFEKSGNEFVGWAGIANLNFETHFTPATEIGWSLLPEFWGKGYATESAKGWLNQAFDHFNLDEIVAFAVTANLPSHRVMDRVGLKRDEAKDFDHPMVPKEIPHLIRHLTWSITANDWNTENKKGG